MADPILAIRTVTEVTLFRYTLEGTPAVLTPHPVALPMNPENCTLNPGMNQEDVRHTNYQGEDQIIFSFLKEASAELSMGFGAATPELEGVLINRVAKNVADGLACWCHFSAVAEAESIAAKPLNSLGAEVPLQNAATSEAKIYYIDPTTKLAKTVAVVDATPTGDQAIVGAGLALTLSPELAATGYNLYGHVPVSVSRGTILSDETAIMYGAYISGVCFDNTVRQLTARRLSWLPGGEFAKEPKRDLKFRVLPDGASDTGLGYSIRYLEQKVSR